MSTRNDLGQLGAGPAGESAQAQAERHLKSVTTPNYDRVTMYNTWLRPQNARRTVWVPIHRTMCRLVNVFGEYMDLDPNTLTPDMVERYLGSTTLVSFEVEYFVDERGYPSHLYSPAARYACMARNAVVRNDAASDCVDTNLRGIVLFCEPWIFSKMYIGIKQKTNKH